MSGEQLVTRLEIAEAVSRVFEDGGGATRDEIVTAAGTASRPQVVQVLGGLPDRRYSRLNELWEELHGIPVGA